MSCPRCHNHVPLEASGYCEACEEIQKELFAEKYLERDEIFCSCGCGRVYNPSAFERHAWRIYYRSGEKPKGHRLS